MPTSAAVMVLLQLDSPSHSYFFLCILPHILRNGKFKACTQNMLMLNNILKDEALLFTLLSLFIYLFIYLKKGKPSLRRYQAMIISRSERN